jgi:Rrf2 family iron-sulfur cluster assembly transcriptional regulator
MGTETQMMLTTKSRYAVMAMVDLAATGEKNKPVKLAEIAARQEIALNYLEQIFTRLKNAGLVKSVKGPGGGYVLELELAQIKISDIVQAVDESVEMTRCAVHGEIADKKGCMKDKTRCLTHDIWEGLTTQITGYLSSITLADVCKKAERKNSVPDFINP